MSIEGNEKTPVDLCSSFHVNNNTICLLCWKCVVSNMKGGNKFLYQLGNASHRKDVGVLLGSKLPIFK